MTHETARTQQDGPPKPSAAPEWLTFVASLVAAICVGLAIWSAVLSMDLRTLRADVAQQQLAVTKGQTVAQVNQKLIQLLAQAAAQTNDRGINTLLASNGISFQVSPKQGSAGAASDKGASAP